MTIPQLPLSTEKAERTAAEGSAATIRMIPTACNESLVEREAIARIVDPEAWMSNVYCQHDIKPFRQQAFAKAEDIQALFSPALAERDEFSALLIAERNVAKDFRRQRDEARKELVAALDILNSFGKCDDDPQFTQVRDRLTSLAERCGREDTVDNSNSATRRPADGGDTPGSTLLDDTVLILPKSEGPSAIVHFDDIDWRAAYMRVQAQASVTATDRAAASSRQRELEEALRERLLFCGSDEDPLEYHRIVLAAHRQNGLALAHEDLCRLSVLFCRASDLRTDRDIRINDWLKEMLTAALQPSKPGEGHE